MSTTTFPHMPELVPSQLVSNGNFFADDRYAAADPGRPSFGHAAVEPRHLSHGQQS